MLEISPMPQLRKANSSLTARVHAFAMVVYLAAFGIAAPLFVVCEDGERHAATELVVATCCPPVAAEPSVSERVPKTGAAAGDGCADFCTDTPLLSGLDVVSPRGIGLGNEVLTAVPPVGFAPRLVLVISCADVGWRSTASQPILGRSTVLLI